MDIGHRVELQSHRVPGVMEADIHLIATSTWNACLE